MRHGGEDSSDYGLFATRRTPQITMENIRSKRAIESNKNTTYIII